MGQDVQRRSTPESLLPSVCDRQVLVIGDTTAGLVLTLLLARAGYDPLLVADVETGVRSRQVLLGPAGRAMLAEAGVELDASACDATRECGSVRVAGGDAGPVTHHLDGQGLWVLERATLHERIREELRRTAVREYRVRAIETGAETVDVTFENGVREAFDCVVETTAPTVHEQSRGDDETGQVSLGQYTAVLEDLPRDRLREYWREDAVVQAVPGPDPGQTLVRVTTTPTEPSAMSTDRFHDVLADLEWEVEPADVLDASTGTSRLVVQATSQGGDWGAGRSASCGAAAFPVAPATGLQATLALGDAWALADELIRGPRPVSDAVASFASNRRQVERRLAAISSPPEGWPRPSPTPTSTLTVLRAVALGMTAVGIGREEIIDRR